MVDDDDIPKTMTAVVVREHGGPDCLLYENDYPVPRDLKEGEVLIKNEYAGLNFIDTYHRTGLYKRELPFIAGQEGAGIVVKKHDNDDNYVKVGDRVVYTTFGTYCDYTRAAISKVIKIPDDEGDDDGSKISISMGIALCCMVQGMTAHYLTTDATAGLTKKGDWMLMYSVGSGTAQWGCQLAKHQGYKVIGTTSQDKITAAAQDACEHLIVLDTEKGKTYADYSSVDIHKNVMEYTNGEGVQCIIDGVGKSTADISIKSLARRGLWISFGNASGAVPPLSLLKLTSKSGYVTRPKLGDYVSTKEELRSRAKEIFHHVANGTLKVGVDLIFSLNDVKKGHEYIEAGKTKGKVMFKIK